MQEAIQTHNISALEENVYARTAVNTSFVKTFINWCNKQDENRFLWLGVSLFGLIGAMVPLTLMCIFFFADNNFSLWIVVCSVNVPVLALNLAAQPPKVTLPTLFLSLLVDTIIMVSCLAIFIIK